MTGICGKTRKGLAIQISPGEIGYGLVEEISKLIKGFDIIRFLQILQAVKVKDHYCRAKALHSIVKGVQTGSAGGNCTPLNICNLTSHTVIVL